MHSSQAVRLLARDLETERFELGSLTRLQAILLTRTWRHDPEVLKDLYCSSAPVSLVRWIRRGPVPNGRNKFAHAIIPKGGKAPIGVHAVKLYPYRSATISLALPERSWRARDAALEVHARAIQHVFVNSDVERFTASLSSNNSRSLADCRRLGFRHSGTLHRHSRDPVTGEISDLVNFELFRDDWENGHWTMNFVPSLGNEG